MYAAEFNRYIYGFQEMKNKVSLSTVEVLGSGTIKKCTSRNQEVAVAGEAPLVDGCGEQQDSAPMESVLFVAKTRAIIAHCLHL